MDRTLEVHHGLRALGALAPEHRHQPLAVVVREAEEAPRQYRDHKRRPQQRVGRVTLAEHILDAHGKFGVGLHSVDAGEDQAKDHKYDDETDGDCSIPPPRRNVGPGLQIWVELDLQRKTQRQLAV